MKMAKMMTIIMMIKRLVIVTIIIMMMMMRMTMTLTHPYINAHTGDQIMGYISQ